jgi:hypothetical protein
MEQEVVAVQAQQAVTAPLEAVAALVELVYRVL